MNKGVNLVLRFPTKKMHEELRRRAREDGMSLNKELIAALNFWIGLRDEADRRAEGKAK